MKGKSVLFISEDKNLISDLKSRFGQDEINITGSRGQPAAAGTISPARFELIIIDSPPADADGIQICRQVRSASGAPILFLVGGDGPARIRGLEAGADECMSKPVDIQELVANIRAMLRRPERPGGLPGDNKGPIVINNLVIDKDNFQARLDKQTLELTSKEFKLLLILAENRGRIVSRQTLLDQVWGDDTLETDRTIDVHICRLRKKIEPGSAWPTRLVSVRGFGYKLAK